MTVIAVLFWVDYLLLRPVGFYHSLSSGELVTDKELIEIIETAFRVPVGSCVGTCVCGREFFTQIIAGLGKTAKSNA